MRDNFKTMFDCIDYLITNKFWTNIFTILKELM